MIKTKVLKEMAREAFETAEEKGWHDKARDYDDIIALINSELGEAVEELRTNADISHRYYRDGDEKPEGFVVEIADAVIRVFDFIGYFETHEFAIDEMCKGYRNAVGIFNERNIKTPSATGLVNTLMGTLTNAYILLESDEPQQSVFSLGAFIAFADHWFKLKNISFESVLKEKMQFNKSREYRHGNRVM